MFKFNFMRVSKVLLVVVVTIGVLCSVYRLGYIDARQTTIKEALQIINNIMSQCRPMSGSQFNLYTKDND